MSINVDQETIAAMHAAGIHFVADVAAPTGSMTITLRPHEVPSFVADPEQGAADRLGVTKSQYLDWVATDGLPRCGATTAKGARCRNPVSGGIQRSLDDWLEEDGGFCTVHGGQTRADARRGR